MSVVVCDRLEKRFGRRVVLDALSMRLEEGRFYALVGPNGAGKSTLIKLLMRFLSPSGGEAHVLGQPLSRDTARANHEIGYVSEDLRFRLPMTLEAFVTLNRRALPRWDAGLFRDVAGALALDGRQRFGALSRGQRMRFFFALALARRPRLILLDEVGSVLDAAARAYVNGMLALAARAGATVLMATNIPSEVQPSVDRVLVLGNGRVAHETSLAEFTTAHVKVRRIAGDERPLWGEALCMPCQSNSDGSTSYVAPRHLLGEADPPLDRRALTTEEMVTYFMNVAAGIKP